MGLYKSFDQTRLQRRSLGWLVHMFTASGACIGVLSLLAIYEGRNLTALWLMCAAILIDSVDGMFARAVKIKDVVPEIDGALLDNIVDFVNYTIVPSFFLLVATNMLPIYGRIVTVIAIIFASAYQFTQYDAKTADHFFKGFPSYWNIAVMYLFFWQMSPFANMIILLVLVLLSFVPIKYVYPSRLDYLTHNRYMRYGMLFSTIIWGAATAGLLWLYPRTSYFLVGVSIVYVGIYIAVSLYRTCVPLNPQLALVEE
ncbi:MAG TPA: CDP-alcohol phosphatidyltransferase family protein [Gammaproteobacteria bacterium]|nr:CDP-alcohol phosphatidyltransferase family protein [Gammaproteobacteria bacterium]